MRGYRFQIRDVTTGLTRTGEMTWPGIKPTTEDFWWLEGNFSCDCNRAALWRDAGGEDETSSEGCNLGPNRYVYDWVEADGVRFIEGDRAVGA